MSSSVIVCAEDYLTWCVQLRSISDPLEDNSLGDHLKYNGLLLTIKATGTNAETKFPTSLPARESFVSNFQNLPQQEVEGRYVIEVNSGQQLNRMKYQGSADNRFRSRLGSTQEWYLINTDPMVGHPIHMHVNHFQIISYNPYTGPVSAKSKLDKVVFYSQDNQLCHYQSSSYSLGDTAKLPQNYLQYLGHDKKYSLGGVGTLGYVTTGEFRDVINVPPLSNITIRFMAHKYVGEVVIHCHILIHEDIGMMLATEIVNTTIHSGGLLDTLLSEGSHPGQCDVCDPFPFNQDVTECRRLKKTKQK